MECGPLLVTGFWTHSVGVKGKGSSSQPPLELLVTPTWGYSLLIMATQHLLQLEGSCRHRFSDKMMDVLLFCSNMGAQILFRRLVVDFPTLRNNSILFKTSHFFSPKFLQHLFLLGHQGGVKAPFLMTPRPAKICQILCVFFCWLIWLVIWWFEEWKIKGPKLQND